jgi:hypothetical protein
MTSPLAQKHTDSALGASPQEYPVARFFAAAAAAFEAAACGSSNVVVRDFHVAGQAIRLRFAGSAWLPRFTAALEHLRTAHTDRPDLTISVWDDASTGTRMPPTPWESEAYSPRGEIPSFCDARFMTGFQLDAGLLSVLDTHTGQGLIWCADARRLPRYELTFPARSVMYWWLRHGGLQLVHGGGVGTAAGAVLLVGKGGSGKSTTALACLYAGLSYAGDDYVAISHTPTPTVHSVYCSGKLHADHIQRLPYLLPHIRNAQHLEREKALLLLSDTFAERLPANMPLRAIVVPKVTSRAATGYRPTSTVHALAALGPSTIRQLPGAGAADHVRMVATIRHLPAYVLELGADLHNIPRQIHLLIDEAASMPRMAD